jgi:YVTN family beta-propeller protein
MKFAPPFAALLIALAGCSGMGDTGPPSASYRICVTNEGSGDVTILEGATRKKLATVPVGKEPRRILASPDGKYLYITMGRGVGILDLTSGKLLRTIRTAAAPAGLTLSLDGSKILISDGTAGTVSILNARSGQVERVVPVSGKPAGIAYAPSGRLVYVACETSGDVAVLDADDGAERGRLKAGGHPHSIAILPDGSSAVVLSEATGEVQILDTESGRVRADVRLPEGSKPMECVVRRDGARVFVTNGPAGTVTVHDSRGALLHAVRVGPNPRGLALSPDQRTLYVANGPSDNISVVDLASYREIDRVAVGSGAYGVAVVEAPRR